MPSSQGRVLQKHKFDPKGIPGVFAGYEVKSWHELVKTISCMASRDLHHHKV